MIFKLIETKLKFELEHVGNAPLNAISRSIDK